MTLIPHGLPSVQRKLHLRHSEPLMPSDPPLSLRIRYRRRSSGSGGGVADVGAVVWARGRCAEHARGGCPQPRVAPQVERKARLDAVRSHPGSARMPGMNSAFSEGNRPPRLSTSAELTRGGLTHSDIAKLVDHGRLIRLRKGVYAHVDGSGSRVGGGADHERPAHEVRERAFLERTLAAARSIEPGTVISHGSALALHGLPLHGIPLGLPTVTRHRAGGGSRRSSALICANLPLEGVVTDVDGIPVTSPARTIIDVARTVGLESGVCAADAALRRTLCSRSQLRDEAEAAKGRTGVARARRLPELTSGLAESVLESLIRLILVLGGLPEPELQVRLGVRGGERFRVDFYWRQWKLIGEADGFGKYGATPGEIRENWIAERERQRRLEDAGYTVIRWTWKDIYRPDLIVGQVREVMLRQERLGLGPAQAA